MRLLPGKRPTDLGARDGKLKRPPRSPNCVHSQLGKGTQAIEPLRYKGDPTEAMRRLQKVIADMPRTKVVTSEGLYMHVEFESALLGYVDDVEFLGNPQESVIHVRSASRLGHSDLGANRKRVEAIRRAFSGEG